MASKRRYQPIAKFPVYSTEFDSLRMESRILNTEQRASVNSFLWDKTNIKAELVKIITEQKPALQEKLDDLQYRFQNLKTDRRNQGKEIPTEMPIDLLNEKYKIEAAQDICEEEKDLLTDRLKTYTDKAEKVDESLILRNGLQCSGSFHGIGTNLYRPDVAPAMLDGQRLEMLSKEKILIISEKSSPYFGMAVSDYRKLSKQFYQDRMKADEALLIKMQKDAKEKGEEKPYATGQSFNRQVSKSSLPPFPSWATNWKAKEVVKEEVTYTRKPKYSK